jgi:hypothetical protein
MKFNDLDMLVKTAEEIDLYKKVIDFFTENPAPKDEAEVHVFAEKNGIDKHQFEKTAYALLGAFLSGGRSSEFNGDYDEEQLSMGKQVEREHFSSDLPDEILDILSEKISRDHLAETKGVGPYYTELKALEDKIGVKGK